VLRVGRLCGAVALVLWPRLLRSRRDTQPLASHQERVARLSRVLKVTNRVDGRARLQAVHARGSLVREVKRGRRQPRRAFRPARRAIVRR
jgi:hypothetical protein